MSKHDIDFDYHFLGHHELSGHLNMAIEEALYRKAAEEGTAFLRFYSFPKDLIVYGYAQKGDVIRNGNLGYTRRLTGGSHVQVGPNTLAYSIIVPHPNETFGFLQVEKMRAYYARRIAAALGNIGLKKLEVDDDASTINFHDKVVASHAMLWGVKSAVFHGLVVVDPYNVSEMERNIRLGHRKIGSEIYTESSALRNIPALSTLPEGEWQNSRKTGSELIKKFVCAAISESVTEKACPISDVSSFPLDEGVKRYATDLLATKYATSGWLRLRDPVFTRERDLVEEIPGEELDGPLKGNQPYCLWLQVPDKKFKKMAEPK